MLVFDKDLFKEYCKIWEPAYYNNIWATKWAEKQDGKEAKNYKGQFLYVEDEEVGKYIISLGWCRRRNNNVKRKIIKWYERSNEK